MDKRTQIKSNLDDLIQRFPELYHIQDNIWKVFLEMIRTYESGGKILVCGNGGSAADADHIVGELMKGFMVKREVKEAYTLPWVEQEQASKILTQLQNGLPALNLCSHVALNTAFANDVNAELIFAQQVFTLGKENDLFIGISTSGNSKNVYYGGLIAKLKGMTCVALTGEKGGIMKEHFDITINVPSDITPTVQEYHLPIYHALCKWVEEYFFIL